VATLSRGYRRSAETLEALTLLALYLRRHTSGPVTVFFDAPMSKSGELARQTQKIGAEHGLLLTAAAVPVPERQLLTFAGAVATSDTHLIDACTVLVDLAGELIRQHWPDYPRLIVLK